MKTAIIYCRVSTKKQEQDGNSLDSQELACRKYCDSKEIKIISVFRESCTGKTTNRKELSNAMQKVESENIDYFIIFDIDRFSREGYGAYTDLKNKLAYHGTELKDSKNVIGDTSLVFENEHLDMSKYAWNVENPSEYAEAMISTQAKMEGKKILQRTIPAEIKYLQEGYHCGQANYGYKNSKIKTPFGKRTIQIEETTESIFIKKAYELKAKGCYTNTEIANVLNTMGYKSRNGKKMNDRQLSSYIKNPIYAGIIVHKWRGCKPFKAQYKGLVSIELWNKANYPNLKIIDEGGLELKIIEGKIVKSQRKITKSRNAFNKDIKFRGLIKAKDGTKFTGSFSKGRHGGRYGYYHTLSTKEKRENIAQKKFEKEIYDFVNEIRISEKYKSFFEERLEYVFRKRKKELQENKEILLKREKELDLEIERLDRNILEVDVKLTSVLQSIDSSIKKFREEREKARSEIESYNSMNLNNPKPFIEFGINLIGKLPELLKQSEKYEEIKAIFDLIFEDSPEYQKIINRTPNLYPVFALLSQIKNPQNENLGDCMLWQAWTSGNLKNFEKYYDSLSSEIKEKFNRQLDKWEEIYNMALNRRMFGL